MHTKFLGDSLTAESYVAIKINGSDIRTYVTKPAKTGHVGTNYTPSLCWSYLSIGKVYFHSVTCIMMPIKC